MMRKKKFRRMKDIKVGDIIVNDSGTRIGLVTLKGRTLLHSHIYIEVMWDIETTEKLYADNFAVGEIYYRHDRGY